MMDLGTFWDFAMSVLPDLAVKRVHAAPSICRTWIVIPLVRLVRRLWVTSKTNAFVDDRFAHTDRYGFTGGLPFIVDAMSLAFNKLAQRRSLTAY